MPYGKAVLASLLVGLALEFPLGARAEEAGAGAATVFEGLDPKDTTEDPSFVEMGEALARPLRAKLIGKAAPSAVLKTIDGDSIDLAKSYGKKPVYLKFWATWCVPCRQQMPSFERLYEALGDKVQVIAVNMGISDDLKSIRIFRNKFSLKMPIVMDDGRLAALFHARVTPQHVLIGKDARFAYIGHAHNEALTATINDAAAQADVVSPPVPSDASPAEKVFRVGDVVTGLHLTSITGKNIEIGRSDTNRANGVFLFSSWCEWYLEKTRPSTSQACAKAREGIEALSRENTALDWIGIAGGPWAIESDLADYISKNKVSFPVAMDETGAVFRSFGVRDLPAIVLLDATGKIVRILGPDEKDIANAVRAALKLTR